VHAAETAAAVNDDDYEGEDENSTLSLSVNRLAGFLLIFFLC